MRFGYCRDVDLKSIAHGAPHIQRVPNLNRNRSRREDARRGMIERPCIQRDWIQSDHRESRLTEATLCQKIRFHLPGLKRLPETLKRLKAFCRPIRPGSEYGSSTSDVPTRSAALSSLSISNRVGERIGSIFARFHRRRVAFVRIMWQVYD